MAAGRWLSSTSGQPRLRTMPLFIGIISLRSGVCRGWSLIKSSPAKRPFTARGQRGRTGGQARGAGTHGTNNVWGRAETFHPKYLQAFTHIKDSPSPGSELGK